MQSTIAGLRKELTEERKEAVRRKKWCAAVEEENLAVKRTMTAQVMIADHAKRLRNS